MSKRRLLLHPKRAFSPLEHRERGPSPTSVQLFSNAAMNSRGCLARTQLFTRPSSSCTLFYSRLTLWEEVLTLECSPPV
jgi:hypothetical protein